MSKKIITIEGYDFPFSDELLHEYADKMGDNLYDTVILTDDILDFAPSVSAAVKQFGIEGVVERVEERIRSQLSIFTE